MIKNISVFGRISTPAAMVVFMTLEIVRSMPVDGYWKVLVFFGAVGTAVGVEIVGILAGSTFERFWRQGDQGRAFLSLALLLVYTAAAIIILRHNPTLLAVPIVAAVVYLVSALADSLDRVERERETAERGAIDYERQQAALQAERDHEALLKQKELDAQVKIERARAKAAKPAAQVSQTSQSVPQAATLYECACGQVYDKPQSYSAHTRHCEAHKAISQNGHVKEIV